MKSLPNLLAPRLSARGRIRSLAMPVLAILAIGCGATIYTNQEFASVTATHKQVAVLPFKVTVDTNKLPKGVTIEMVRKQEKDEAYQFQKALYSALLERQGKGEYTVQFEDVDRINAILTQNNITYENLSAQTKDSLATLLGVDAIMAGGIRRSQPMSTGMAVTMGLLIGAWGSTNRVDVDMTIHNGADGKLLWNYTHEASGSIGSSAEGLAKSLMKNVSKKFPYRKPAS